MEVVDKINYLLVEKNLSKISSVELKKNSIVFLIYPYFKEIILNINAESSTAVESVPK